MDMLPPNFWDVPSEVRRVDVCAPEFPCLKVAGEHDPHRVHREHHHDPELAPIIDTRLTPGPGALRFNAPS
jgi:hypothetical protein